MLSTSQHVGGVCVIQAMRVMLPNGHNWAFRHILIYNIVSFSIWSGAWQLKVVGLSSIVVWFFFLLFSLPTGNVHNCPLCFLLFNFSLYSINFLFCSFSVYRIFILFNLVLQLQFLICLVFHFSPYFLKFLILSFVRLLKGFFSFNFII